MNILEAELKQAEAEITRLKSNYQTAGYVIELKNKMINSLQSYIAELQARIDSLLLLDSRPEDPIYFCNNPDNDFCTAMTKVAISLRKQHMANYHD